MEGYFNRFFIGYFLILIVIAIGFYVGLSLVAIIIGALLFEVLFYLLDLKFLSKRKTELANRLINIFNAEPISKGLVKFKVETFDLFAEIEVDFKLGITQLANFEDISFHIPRYQIDQLAVKPRLELKEAEIDGVQTYVLHQTDGVGLNFAKEKLEKILNQIKLLPAIE